MENLSPDVQSQDLDDLRSRVQLELESDQNDKAMSSMGEWITRIQEGTLEIPSGEERLWLFNTFRVAAQQAARLNEALTLLEPLNTQEPRDREVSYAYGCLLALQGRGDEAARVLRSLLVHHKSSLAPDIRAESYVQLGRHYLAEADHFKARIAFDQALVADPNCQWAVDGMLEMAEQVSDPEESFRSRKLLLKRVRDPRFRAITLERQGDALRNQHQDRRGALKLYEEALLIQPGSPPLLQSMAEVLRELGHLEKASDYYLQLADEPELSPKESEEYLEAAWSILKNLPTRSKKHLRVLDGLLDLSPSRFNLLQELVEICAAMEDWRELAQAYRRMIQRQLALGGKEASRAIPLLYRKLGELCWVQLQNPDQAIDAYLEACQLLPSETDLRRQVLDLLRNRPERASDGLLIARELIGLIPNDLEIKKTYAELLIKTSKFDEALCVLRVIRQSGPFSDSLEQIYRRLQRPKLTLSQVPLTPEMLRYHVRTRSPQYVLNSAFAIAGVVLQRIFMNDLSSYGLREKNQLSMNKDILFVQMYKQIGRLLGFRDLPRVYVNMDGQGMFNASIDRPAFIVGGDLLSGTSDRTLAFVIAQQLYLIRPEYVLTTILEPLHLKTVLMVLTQKVEPTIELRLTDDVKAMRKELDKRLKADLFHHLKETVDTIIREGIEVDVWGWVECVADESNRIGLLMCDDLAMAEHCISQYQGVKGSPNINPRINRLQQWACSEEYFSLRKQLGVSITSS